MGRYPEAFLEQIKTKVDIVDLISAYTSVQRKGRDYWACCPFHNEKTPSFQIRSDHQYYRCYGCGKHGNIFTFLTDYEQMSFVEAVETLAKRAGLELPAQINDPEAKARKEKQEKIYAVNRETARFYYDNLFKDEGAPAREYFAKRGLDARTINIFGMGYSADFNTLPKFLMKKGYDAKTLVEAGVASVNSRGETIDFFGGRIIIPIIGGNGKVLGFTGRVLNSSPDFAKYKNTPATAVFNKRKNLFGINLFKKFKHGDVRAMILVEGHMDVISLYQAGIRNVVASMGTSLTMEQCREIKRYADVVYVSFDGDSAGQNATLRGLDLLKNEGLDVKVVCLDDNLDPDDYVRKFGKDGYLRLLDEALPLIDYKLKKVEESFDLKSSDDKIKYARAAIAVLNELDSVEKEIYAESVGKKSGLNTEVVIEQASGKSKQSIAAKGAAQEAKSDALDSAERFVVSSFIYGKSFIDTDSLPTIRACLSDEKYLAVFDHFLKGVTAGRSPKAADVFDVLDDEAAAAELVDSLDKVSPSEQEAYYRACLQKLLTNRKIKELNRLATELNNETDETAREKIKAQIKELTKAQPK